MSSAAFAELRQSVLEALELPLAERQTYFRRLADTDAELAEQVERLVTSEPVAAAILRTAGAREALDFHLWADGVSGGSSDLKNPADGASGGDGASDGNRNEGRPDPAALCAGDEIGSFLVTRVLGEGGMGIVYLAEQEVPVRRQVALKILRPGLGGRDALTRFENEQQSLALLDHPNIAHILDAGVIDGGRPYLVMDYVPGRPIHQYCEEQGLNVRDRLRLFTQVCRAIHHAHQRGILHRDIKPENVLVVEIDGAPHPKVIDFGIAKALSEPGGEDRGVTRVGQFVGTLDYASPEQADPASTRVDVTSDVYSLGVMLYQLLTGELPFDSSRMREAGTLEALRILREEDPPPPSRRIEGRPGNRRLRGELDWIVMRSLHKDPDRRYASAHDMARDLERYLTHEPVEAGPPSFAYRVKKLAQRNRVAFAATAAIAIALLGGVVVSSTLYVRAQGALEMAESEAAKSAKVVHFLSDMLGSVDPRDGARDATVREFLDDTALEIDGSLTDEPAVRAAVHATVAKSYLSLGITDPALDHARSALEIEQSLRPEEDPACVAALVDLAWVHHFRGEYDIADSLYLRAEELGRREPLMREAFLGTILTRRADLRGRDGDVTTAIELYREALAIGRKAPEERVDTYLESLDGLGRFLPARSPSGAESEPAARRSVDESLAFRREAVSEAVRLLPPSDVRITRYKRRLAQCLVSLGQVGEAESLLRELVADTGAGAVGDPIGLAGHLMALGHLLRETDRSAEAERLYERALELRIRAYGEEHYSVATSRMVLASLREEAGDLAAAERLYEESLAIRRKVLPNHLTFVFALEAVGLFRLRHEGPTAALPYLEESLDAGRVILGEDSVDLAVLLLHLAQVRLALGEFERSADLARQALELRTTHLPPGHPEIGDAKERLQKALTARAGPNPVRPDLTQHPDSIGLSSFESK